MGNSVLTRESTPPGQPRVGVLVAPGEPPEPYLEAIRHGEGAPVPFASENPLPADIGGLLVGGSSHFQRTEAVPEALNEAINRDIPVLGIGWGMHALNRALGGGDPRPVSDCAGVRKTVFISPGAKISFTIAGSGWVGIPVDHTHGLTLGDIADGLLPSCYSEDRVVYAIENPGRHWLIGVQWHAERIESLPKGFDSLILALVERSGPV